MTTDEALADIYYIAGGIATVALTSKGLPSTQISARLQDANRKLQDALRMYEFVRGDLEGVKA